MKNISLTTLIVVSLSACDSDTVSNVTDEESESAPNTYVRMFPNLPPFAPQSAGSRAAAESIGAISGLMDAGDDLSDPVQSIVNQPVFSPNNLDNPLMTAGVTFVGQFLDHDLTFDRESTLGEQAIAENTVNFRTPAFDLDTVYGLGPTGGSQELYERTNGAIKFKIEEIPGSESVSRGGVLRLDLPRDDTAMAIMGDNRNDENSIVSQLHLAMMLFHNAVTDELMAEPDTLLPPLEMFNEAQRIVRWHYQWIILNEFLPATIGQERVDRMLLSGLQHYNPNGQGGGRLPIEFSMAAYRFGHSQVRPSYRLNFGSDDASQFFALILDLRVDPESEDPDDLRGGKRAPRRFIDWQTFFDFGDGNVRQNKIIDTQITSNLFELPGSRVPSPGLPSDGVLSLPSRNLIRHVDFGIPSGQDIATKMGLRPLQANQLSELASVGMDESTPLWYYVLKEAEVLENGLRLGPVGAGIVGEVFIGLLQSDPESYLSVEPDWTPTLSTSGDFRIVDLLLYAGTVFPLDISLEN